MPVSATFRPRPGGAGEALPVGCDMLLLAAFLPELVPLQSTLGQEMRGHVGALDVVARVVGIGLPAAAIGAAMHIAELRPRAVVAIGTCGAYPDPGGSAAASPLAPLAIGDVVAARRVCLADGLVVAGGAQFPEPMAIAAQAHGVFLEALVGAGARPVDVATTLGITVSDASAIQIAQALGAQVEHLEAFGIAAACAVQALPFGAAFGVANRVGSRARAEWRAHHHEAAAAAADLVLEWLRGPRAPA